MATLNLRGFDDAAARGIKAAAGAHMMTLSEYVARLFQLHMDLVGCAAQKVASPEEALARKFLREVHLPLLVT